MVLVTFAETKVTRRAGAKPGIKKWWAVPTLQYFHLILYDLSPKNQNVPSSAEISTGLMP